MEKYIKNDKYQVFLMSCRCSFPINFVTHHWFVINKKGIISRWEVLFQKDCCGTSWQHLHLNAKEPFEPLGTFYLNGKSFSKSKTLSVIEGDENSLAKKMGDFIENSNTQYPFCDQYLLWGPNSNTYVHWVINKFPECKVTLPRSAFGKDTKLPKNL